MEFVSESEVERLTVLEELAAAIQRFYEGGTDFTIFGRRSIVATGTRTWVGCSGAVSAGLGLAVSRMSLERPRGGDSTGVVGDSALLLADVASGRLLAAFHAEVAGAARTAAATAIAVRLLRPGGTRVATVIGTGTLARWHVTALDQCLGVERVAVCGRLPERAEAFVAAGRSQWRAHVFPASDVPAAVLESQLVVTATTARAPVLHGEWVAAGAVVVGVGSHDPSAREFDPAVLSRAEVILVDDQAGALGCGEFAGLTPGQLTAVQTLGEYARCPGGYSAGIAVYKSVGSAEQDLITAAYLWNAYQKVRNGHEGVAHIGPQPATERTPIRQRNSV